MGCKEIVKCLSLFWRCEAPSGHLLCGHLTWAQKQEYHLYLEFSTISMF